MQTQRSTKEEIQVMEIFDILQCINNKYFWLLYLFFYAVQQIGAKHINNAKDKTYKSDKENASVCNIRGHNAKKERKQQSQKGIYNEKCCKGVFSDIEKYSLNYFTNSIKYKPGKYCHHYVSTGLFNITWFVYLQTKIQAKAEVYNPGGYHPTAKFSFFESYTAGYQ